MIIEVLVGSIIGGILAGLFYGLVKYLMLRKELRELEKINKKARAEWKAANKR